MASNKISLAMFQLGLILLGIFAAGSWAAPTAEERQEIYLGTCQSSCQVVNNHDQAQECHEKFCPTYVSYLLTGLITPDVAPSLASPHHKEASEFCATWMIHLIKELGWNSRIRLNLKQCICAAGKDCLVK